MFTHLDSKNRPTMVDVTEKTPSKRTARAQAIVVLPPEIVALFEGGDLQTKKGAVFQTAILAGIMGAKRTADLIPLCHPLGLDRCEVDIFLNEKGEAVVECTASLTAKTGVEMEALTGATVAALTIYDMCKAFSHGILIREIRLLEKKGGKSDFKTAAN